MRWSQFKSSCSLIRWRSPQESRGTQRASDRGTAMTQKAQLSEAKQGKEESGPFETVDAFVEITERDMDFLFLQEFECNPAFSSWFLRSTGVPDPETYLLVEVRRSVSTYDGETDLLAVYRRGAHRHALLIENKIAASFTDAQPARYVIRGNDGVAKGRWDDFKTVLVAPAHYLTASTDAIFDCKLSYEEISEFLARDGDAPRAKFKRRMLETAASKSR